jgi:hypothetical protein
MQMENIENLEKKTVTVGHNKNSRKMSRPYAHKCKKKNVANVRTPKILEDREEIRSNLGPFGLVFLKEHTSSIPKKSSQRFLDTDESIAKTCLYTSVCRQRCSFFFLERRKYNFLLSSRKY